MKPNKESARYPYTYACDWLRMCGKADTRSEAAQLYDGYDEACRYADQYVLYWSIRENAESLLEQGKREGIYG